MAEVVGVGAGEGGEGAQWSLKCAEKAHKRSQVMAIRFGFNFNYGFVFPQLLHRQSVLYPVQIDIMAGMHCT